MKLKQTSTYGTPEILYEISFGPDEQTNGHITNFFFCRNGYTQKMY